MCDRYSVQVMLEEVTYLIDERYLIVSDTFILESLAFSVIQGKIIQLSSLKIRNRAPERSSNLCPGYTARVIPTLVPGLWILNHLCFTLDVLCPAQPSIVPFSMNTEKVRAVVFSVMLSH